jgi:hypothetical protein
LPHLAYSPGSAPGDFSLFGHIKRKPSDYNCEIRKDPMNAVTEIVTEADQEVLLTVFESWLNRPKWVIKHEGEYYTK